MKENKDSGSPEPKPEETKIFNVKSMVDGDLRLPKKLRQRIKWLGNHTDVVIEIVGNSKDSITLKFSKSPEDFRTKITKPTEAT